MKTGYASQYGTPCIIIEVGDDLNEIVIEAKEIGAEYEEEPGEWCFVVQFPNRPPELYTKSALLRSKIK